LPNEDSFNVHGEAGCELEEDGFHIIDWKNAKQQKWKKGVMGMYNPGGSEAQKGLIRFGESGEAKSFLFYDEGCIFEKYYFRGGTAPIGRFPWDYYIVPPNECWRKLRSPNSK